VDLIEANVEELRRFLSLIPYIFLPAVVLPKTKLPKTRVNYEFLMRNDPFHLV